MVLKTRRWCSVPQCNFKGNRSLFHFPSDRNLSRKWSINCKMGKKVTRNMFVCEAHFTSYDFYPRRSNENYRLRLKKNVVPSCNLPKSKFDKVLSKKQLKNISERNERARNRLQRFEQQSLKNEGVENMSKSVLNILANKTENIPKSDFNSITDDDYYKDHCEDCDQFENSGDTNVQNSSTTSELEILAAEALLELQNVSNKMKETDDSICITDKSGEISDLLKKKEKFTLFGLLRNDDDLITFTGINFQLLNNLCEAFRLCEMKPIYCSLTVSEKIVLCLCRLKLDISFKCLSVLFGVTRKTSSKIFHDTLSTLAYVLKHAIYWPSKEEILCSMPTCFNKFKQTTAVMDCTEIHIQKPNCLNCRLRFYSHYKGHETMKFLVVVSPSGLVMFISEPYGGRASDKSIFNQSDILRLLEPTRDALMVDKGFAIEEECAMSRIKLIIPPKLSSNRQFTLDNCIMTQEVASARVHVERTIQRIKLFKIMSSKISHTIAPYMGEISKVICGIVNLSGSIIDDDGYPNTKSAPRVQKKRKRMLIRA